MLYQKYKFTFTSIISLWVFLTSYPSSVICQSSPVQNPHALNLQGRYNNEVDSTGKARSREKSESINGDSESLWQLLNNGREISDHPNPKDSINSLDSLVIPFPARFLFDSILRRTGADSGQISMKEKENLLQKFLWETRKGKSPSPPILRGLNHLNGWRIKPDELAKETRFGLQDYEDRRVDINPLGDLSQLRNSNEPKGAMNLDSFSGTFTNEKRNNAGFICHFKLCQLGASGKRRLPGGVWNFKGDHDYD